MASCSNFFDWMNQSSQHMNLAFGNYPLIAEMASIATSEGDFDQLIRELDPDEIVQAENEKALWWRSYGFEWGENQCVNESSPGESGAKGTSTWTRGKADPTIEDVKSIQRALSRAGYDPGPIDGKWGAKSCGAAYLFKIERLKDYNQDLDWNFFANLGFPGQDGQDFAKNYGTVCRPYYSKYVKSRESDIEAIQMALVRMGYLSNANVTGKWNETTCKAIFKFQRNTFGDTKRGVLDRDTLIGMGFAPAVATTYESLYSMKCQDYWGGDETIPDKKPGTPKQDDTTPDVTPPAPQRAGFPIWAGLLLLGALGGGYYISKRKR